MSRSRPRRNEDGDYKLIDLVGDLLKFGFEELHLFAQRSLDGDVDARTTESVSLGEKHVLNACVTEHKGLQVRFFRRWRIQS